MFRFTATLLAFTATVAGTKPDDHIEFYYSGTSGSTVMQICPAIWKPGAYDPCQSYFIGVIDGLAVSKSICPPNGVSNMQLSQLAYDAIKQHPELWDRPAVLIVLNELQGRYPCARARRGR